MIENSTGEIGHAAIDAYLDSVEQAMLAVHAPRRDRMQVLEDIESQIADMLAEQPTPLTEDAVRDVIGKLEPPSHFATMYGNGRQPRAANAVSARSAWRWPSPWPALMGVPWTRVAVVSISLMVASALLIVFYLLVNRRPPSPELLVFSLFATFCAATGTLVAAYWQFRTRSKWLQERDLFVNCVTVYAVVVSLFLIFMLTIATDGAALVPIGILGLLYILYAFVQWMRRWLKAALSQEPVPAHNDAAEFRQTAEPIGTAARAV